MYDNKGNYLGGRLGDAPLPADDCGVEAADAGLRQADDLLSAVDLDARGHPRHPRDHDAGGQCEFPAPARRWLTVGHLHLVRRAARAERPRAGIPDW